MIAFRLILLRIKFTTCATCHAFYLKRYQTSCSFCVYIVSTHHATILIAPLIPTNPPPCLSHPTKFPASQQSQHNSAQVSYSPHSQQSQHNAPPQVSYFPLHTLPILYPIRLKFPYNPPGSPHSPYSTSHQPLIAHCSLLIANCSLLTANCSLLIAHCSLLTANCSLLIAHCSLLTAHCSLLTANCSLLIAHCSLLIAHCSLLTANC